MKPLTLNEALKYAGLPQLNEAKKRLSSDELKAKILPKLKGEAKKHAESAQFRFSHRGDDHIDDRYNDEDGSKSDVYDSTAGGWFLRVAVLDDGSFKVVNSEKARSTSDD